MPSLTVEYLTGRVMAMVYNDRQRAEWPPHPARLYSALVAAWAEEEAPDPEEAEALEWLAAQPPPALTVGPASERSVMSHFVPVNDVSVVDPSDKERVKLEEARAGREAAKAEVEGLGDGVEPRRRKAAEKALAGAEKELLRAEGAWLAASARAVAPLGKVSDEDKKRANRLMPDTRLRQARTFPSATPVEPRVVFTWAEAPPPALGAALARLAPRLTRLGHSASLTHCTWADQAVEPTLVPDPEGRVALRVPGPGQLALLRAEHERHGGVEPRVLSFPTARYREVASPSRALRTPQSRFAGEWIVLRRVGGPRLPSVAAVAVAQAARNSLLRHADQPPHPALSGHEADGAPLAAAHLAVVALPNVGHEHADGAILGLALVLPAELSDEGRRAVHRALARWVQAAETRGEPLRLLLGRAGVLELEWVEWGEPPLATLRADTWRGPSRRWLSATPVALDRNPGQLRTRSPEEEGAAWAEAEEGVARACVLAGLPRPARVIGRPSVTMPGTTKAVEFPSFPPGDGKVKRVKAHMAIEFEEPVEGPLLLGAGRYLGLGLFRPLREDNDVVR